MRNKNNGHKNEAPDSAALIAHLRSKGWNVSIYDKPTAINSCVLGAYQPFVEIVEECINPQGTVWFNCAKHFAGEADLAFAWDEWEKLSLEAIPENEFVIKEFWRAHRPIVISVKEGLYSYFAINVEDNGIHYGYEPEFEDADLVSSDIIEFFEMVIEGTLPPLARQIFE